MTTYNIGIGQTYTTYTEANAAITFIGGDVVDGLGGSFSEKWNITEAGTSGHPIVFQNATINAPTDYGLAIASTGGYQSFKNLTISAPTRNVYSSAASTGLIFENIISSGGGGDGFYLTSKSNSSYKNISVINAPGVNGFILTGSASNVVIDGLSVDNSGTSYSVRLASITGLTADNIYVEDSLNSGLSISASEGNISKVRTLRGAGAQLVVTGMTATGVLSISDIIITSPQSTSLAGIYLTSNTAPTTGYTDISNAVVNNGAYQGVNAINTKNVNLSKVAISGCNKSGFSYNDSCANITTIDSLADSNLWDGFSGRISATNLTYTRCIAKNNGSVTDSGDGFTFHNTCSGVKISFCVAAKNKNTAVANIGTCDGVVYNNTFYNNHAPGFKRGMIWHSVTGGLGWTYKNNIIQNTTTGDDYAGILVMIESGATVPTMDYNCYWSTNPTPFWVHNGGITGTPDDYTKYDFAGWKTYSNQDANSIFADPKIVSPENNVFLLLPDSPCINNGAWISSINDNGIHDIWNKKVYGIPNIGADQGAGIPYNLRKVIDIGQSIR